MKPDQFAAIYRYHADAAEAMPMHKFHHLPTIAQEWDPILGVLYLPLYSLGMAAHGMSSRIEYLRAKAAGRDLQFFAYSKLEVLEEICDEKYKGNNRFGDFFIRLYEIRKRAIRILEIGEDVVRENLNRIDVFPSEQTFKKSLKFLKVFQGISETSAQHVLMELGWPIVKPDRHIQRILYRLGGWNDFFDSEDGDKQLTPSEWYRFQEKWNHTVSEIVNWTVNRSDFCALNSRKIDICLMWYSQTQRRSDPSLSAPLCTADPSCLSCEVSDCTLRRHNRA